MHYLPGFDDEPMERHLLLFVSTDDTIFVIPEMYDEQIATASWVEDRRSWIDDENPVALIENVGDDLGLAGGTVLLDDRMRERFSQDLRAVLPDATFGLASEALADLRIRKDEHELEWLERPRASPTRSVSRSVTSEATQST